MDNINRCIMPIKSFRSYINQHDDVTTHDDFAKAIDDSLKADYATKIASKYPTTRNHLDAHVKHDSAAKSWQKVGREDKAVSHRQQSLYHHTNSNPEHHS